MACQHSWGIDMAIMLQGADYGALGKALGSFGKTMQERRQQQQKVNQQDILSQAMQQKDSNEMQNILGQAIKAGVPISDIKQLSETYGKNQPSKLDQIIQQYTNPQQQQQQQQQDPQQPQQQDLSNPEINQSLPFANIPDDALAVMASSSDKELQNFGKQNIELRDKAHKNFIEERKYASTQNKNFTDDMESLRRDLPNREASIANMKYSIENRTPETERKDWISSQLGRVGGGRFISPEGQLLESSVKNFLIDDLASIPGGRPNMFLEQRIVNSLAGLGKSRLANEAVTLALDSRHKRDQSKLETYTRLKQEYRSSLGYVPDNISELVSETVAPFYKEIQNNETYQLRRIQERDKGLEELASKKVIPGTPLTFEMMNYLSSKYGVEGARERVKKVGYTIPTKAEYERYRNG